jgi:hypothetical protein
MKSSIPQLSAQLSTLEAAKSALHVPALTERLQLLAASTAASTAEAAAAAAAADVMQPLYRYLAATVRQDEAAIAQCERVAAIALEARGLARCVRAPAAPSPRPALLPGGASLAASLRAASARALESGRAFVESPPPAGGGRPSSPPSAAAELEHAAAHTHAHAAKVFADLARVAESGGKAAGAVAPRARAAATPAATRAPRAVWRVTLGSAARASPSGAAPGAARRAQPPPPPPPPPSPPPPPPSAEDDALRRFAQLLEGAVARVRAESPAARLTARNTEALLAAPEEEEGGGWRPRGAAGAHRAPGLPRAVTPIGSPRRSPQVFRPRVPIAGSSPRSAFAASPRGRLRAAAARSPKRLPPPPTPPPPPPPLPGAPLHELRRGAAPTVTESNSCGAAVVPAEANGAGAGVPPPRLRSLARLSASPVTASPAPVTAAPAPVTAAPAPVTAAPAPVTAAPAPLPPPPLPQLNRLLEAPPRPAPAPAGGGGAPAAAAPPQRPALARALLRARLLPAPLVLGKPRLIARQGGSPLRRSSHLSAGR